MVDSPEVLSKIQVIVEELESLRNPDAVAGMARYGINPDKAYGVSIPSLRKIARKVGKSHQLAEGLWESEIHEARILASMIEEPTEVTDDQMERWAKDFNSWDLCDQCCNNLFRKLESAHGKAIAWTSRQEEFVKRSGFTLIACLAVHDKAASDDEFIKFLPLIKREATDSRNFVKKAVNWSLRQIGKRNPNLNRDAVALAEEILQIDSRPAKWIASDAIRELTGEKVRKKLGYAPEDSTARG
jgi:3-methyladenine DNA glycosylase AlkD